MKTTKNHKKWLSKELHTLINEKPRVINEWKNDPNQEHFKSYKVLRNNVYRTLPNTPDDYTKQFFENPPNSKEEMGFIKNKLTQLSRLKILQYERGHNVISDKKKLCLLFE